MVRGKRQAKSEPPAARTCGECRACCVTLSFAARAGEAPFTKPPNTPCRHLVQLGCGIYPQRPPVCRHFQCGWLSAPNLPEGLRPDRCGVLFCTNDNPFGEGYAVFAYELWPGALEDPLPGWLLEKVGAQMTVLIVRPGAPVEVLTADPEVQAKLAEGGGRSVSG